MVLYSFQPSYSRSSFRFLVVDLCPIEASRIWRHSLHCVTKATVDFSTLVPSCNSPSLYLVLLCRGHRKWQVVWLGKLFRSCLDVLLLCSESNAVQYTKMGRHVCYYATAITNGCGLHFNCISLLLCTQCPSWMSRYAFEHQTCYADVSQLFHFICQILPAGLFI